MVGGIPNNKPREKREMGRALAKVKRALMADADDVVVSSRGGRPGAAKKVAAKWEEERLVYIGQWWDWEDGKKTKERVQEWWEMGQI